MVFTMYLPMHLKMSSAKCPVIVFKPRWVNTLRPRQIGRHFAEDIFKCIFVNENVWIPIKISLKFVPKGPINNIPALVQIMAWHCAGDKPLSEPKMVSLPTHICVTRPQWVKFAGSLNNSWSRRTLRPVPCWATNEEKLRKLPNGLEIWSRYPGGDIL